MPSDDLKKLLDHLGAIPRSGKAREAQESFKALVESRPGKATPAIVTRVFESPDTSDLDRRRLLGPTRLMSQNGGDQLSSSSTDALRLPVQTSNVPIHLQAGDPLDIAGVVDRRAYTLLPVAWRIFRPVINYLLTGFLFLSQTASETSAVIGAKDTAYRFFGRFAAFPNVYSRHTPGRRPSIGGLLLRLCLGGLCIELLVTLDIGRQIGRPRLPVSNRRL